MLGRRYSGWRCQGGAVKTGGVRVEVFRVEVSGWRCQGGDVKGGGGD